MTLAFAQVLQLSLISTSLAQTYPELLLAALSSGSEPPQSSSALIISDEDTSAVGSTDTFLTSILQYTVDAYGQEICLLKLEDGSTVGVMMGWEQDISGYRVIAKSCNC